MFKLEVLTVNTLRLMITFMTFLIKEDLVDPRKI
jgi:hypothetical protein